MTLAQLQHYVGAPQTPSPAMYAAQRGEYQVTGWIDPIDRRPGWWWAVHTDDTIVAMGWSGGLDHRDRDIDIALALMPGDHVAFTHSTEGN